MNVSKLIFSSIDPFKVISVDNQANFVNIYVQSRQRICRCPDCLKPSKKLHSYYSRKFRDLPTFGKNCIIYLRSRKYRCLTETCERKIFTERFADHFEPCKQRTKRLDEKLLTTVLEMGGKSAERVCKSLSMPISDSTLLRLINKAPLPPLDQLKAVGVDDWAYKKRDRYGSILVNLDTGKIVDLLPDREEKSLENWLKKQPAIEVITRDRYHKYVQGATKGAPNALQVTDRWHLLKNLGEAIKRVMIREYSRLSKAIAPKTGSRRSNFPEALPVGKRLPATDGVIK
ncbi:ISL3 family transposase [Pedobacter panaciterrae]|uniref:ISL3 family transposase n=1 Tax=Pedobacter panaciterrae TaxID=363849 RepID=UPI0025968BC2|nr:ISL3 family transposase [uncultured Pedobacter sp.]